MECIDYGENRTQGYVVTMTTQSFIPDMQALSGVQQNSPVPQQQQQSPQTSISHSQSNQATHTQTVSSSSLGGSVSQGSQTSQKQHPIQGVAVSSSISAVPTHSPPITSQQEAAEAAVQATQAAGGTQFITVAVSEHDQQEGLQTQAVHPTYVQYVDTTEPNIYAGSNGQMAGYSVYSVTDASAMYTPATAGYYTGGNGTPVTYSQLVDESGNYKVQGQVIEADGHHNLAPVSAAVTLTNRISPVSDDPRKVAEIIAPFTNDGCVIQTLQSPHDTSQLQLANQQSQTQSQPSHHSQHQNVRDMDIIHVQWLIDNYETAEGVSLPRSTLYNHYIKHCTEHKLDPVNAASFGKLIRSVFLGLRTRRLGTRGNSKYHYYGIRVKPNSPLNQISDDNSAIRSTQSLSQIKSRFKSNLPAKSESNDESNASNSNGVASQTDNPPTQPIPVPQHQHQQYLGDASTAIPNFIEIDTLNYSLPDGITLENIETFKLLYREHCENFLDAVVNLQFALVESLWQSFWRNYNSGINRRDQEKLLGKSKFFQLCKFEPVLLFMRKSDYQFYQNLVDVLIPDVLRPIPSSLTQAIRNFAKCLEAWLIAAMNGCPEEAIKVKMSAVSAFAQTLRRYTSLNHLAQAARAVLQNSSQINQMMADLNRVDFHNVQEQASWVCQCEETTVQRLEQDFKLTLQQQNSLEQWAQWLEGVVDIVLQPYEGKTDFPKAARQFLLKWSFYSSMVIRDLTLRSAASFGSFHLIRLLYDEYMFYLIEHRVAKAINETPIAVMGEFIGKGAKTNSLSTDFVLNSKNLSGCSTSKLMENGTLTESNCSISQDIYSNTTMTNGLKENNTTLQASLIGQPQVRFLSSVADTTGNGESVQQHNKKLKTV
ncbi:DNA-binding protein RFX2 isoform X2 [Parasteatoda tepidariorum]|uniref:DNA-binding protein RFX2 isoform X2 n=1 Tax=Parasteatoda tepidariorum TaxID=114398 RepID=UPI000A2C00D9|nr:DNA-binding protein RFX2 isoform X2 [Parasteatoda tepidariorum]